jgi:adenylate kinase
MMRIVLLGAPGSGKGTQSQRLQAKYGVPQVSSGDLLRDAVARGTELGLKAKAVMDAGRLVSDDIVLGLIRDRLNRADAANGFILDGFPRNIAQANALNELLAEIGKPLDAVLLLDVSKETLVQRLAGRRICPKCGAVYNVHSMAPGATGCSKDGAELYQRPDDKEEVVGKRLEIYEEQTRPLVEHYSKLGLLRAIAGEGQLDEVFERMESAALVKPIAAGKLTVRTSQSPAPKASKRASNKTASSTRAAKPTRQPAGRMAVSKKAAGKKGAGKKKVAKKTASKAAKKVGKKATKKVSRKTATKPARKIIKQAGKKPGKKASNKSARQKVAKKSARAKSVRKR